MRHLIAASLLLLSASPAVAGTLVVRVVDPAGRPVNDAVVVIDPVGSPSPPPPPTGSTGSSSATCSSARSCPWFPVGANVSFPNFDATRHHVYSFSPAKRFELKLFARDPVAQRAL
jgi:hypothetical protein